METIDVTFRESVLCSGSIELENVFTTIKKLADTGIDYVEIGYLKTNLESYPLLNYSPNYISKCYEISKGKTKLVAMMHPEDFLPRIYDKEIIRKISLIRVTANPSNFHLTKDIVTYFKSLGVQVSINLLRSSKFSDEETCRYCMLATQFAADYFYIADSNGHLLPDQVRSKILALKQLSPRIKIGFHAHDNLGLAVINALTAVQSGADIVDSSLLGYGKGAGNLRTELFPLVLGRIGMECRFEEIYKLFEVAQFFHHDVLNPNTFEEYYKFSVYGLYDIGLNIDKEICDIAASTNVEDYELAFNLVKQSDGDISKLTTLLDEIHHNITQRAV